MTPSDTKSYKVTIAVREVLTDGTFGNWTFASQFQTVSGDNGLLIFPTGSAHLLIGGAYDDQGGALPLGGSGSVGNIREVHLFGSAVSRNGIRTAQGYVDIDQATFQQLQRAGLVGFWKAAFDPNGIVSNLIDDNGYAASTNGLAAALVPLTGHENEGVALYVNGSQVLLALSTTPPATAGTYQGATALTFNAGTYLIQEISVWSMTRQEYQVVSDMFGQLIVSNEPFLALYLPGSFWVDASGVGVPLLPMAKYIENQKVENKAAYTIDLGSASLDLQGCPAIGKCGPLVSPNLYTPPGVALTICDTVPVLTTYSLTLNTITGSLAGVINEAYVFVRDHVLVLYAGKKVGDLILTWVSQEQGNVQIVGIVEGAPPAPMANLTNKASYAGATSVSFSAPTSLSYKYQTSNDDHNESKLSGDAEVSKDVASADDKTQRYKATISSPPADSSTTGDNSSGTDASSSAPSGSSSKTGFEFSVGLVLAPMGGGAKVDKISVKATMAAGFDYSSGGGSSVDAWQKTATNKLDELNKYSVRLEGALAPFTGDTFMASLNSLSVPSTTVGASASKTPILPNPNLGGFTTSNPPGALPKTAPTEERFGQRMYVPSPYGQAFVTSQTLDVYQQTLLQTKTTFGFIRVPNKQNSTGHQHRLVPDEQQVYPAGMPGWHDRLSIQSRVSCVRHQNLGDLNRPGVATL